MKFNADDLNFLEQIVHLSVDLHHLNTHTQKTHDISMVQWFVLQNIIMHQGISASSLAELVRLHPSSLTPTLSRLESAGYISSNERPKDQRRKMILATFLGFEVCRRFESRQEKVLQEAKIICGEDSLRRMTRAARYIVEAEH